MSTDRPADSRVGVAVVDPRPAERGALVTAIRKRADLELVSEAAGGLEASDQISRLAPDVAVIALHVLGFDGLRVLEGLKVHGSETRVLILSADHDGSIVYHAIGAGAVGCLPQDAGHETICGAIVAVARGDYAYSPELVEMLAEQIRSRHHGGRGGLSERERAILRLTADGLPAAKVGRELAISESTVKTHLTHIYAKLGVTCAAAAVYEAMRLDILS